jgi:AraC-like DNA-binding protein
MTADLPLRAPQSIRITPLKAPLLQTRKAHITQRGETVTTAQMHWVNERLRSIPNPYLLFVLEGMADIEIGVTDALARQHNLDPQYGRYIARLPERSLLLMPPHIPSVDGSRPHWHGLPVTAPEGYSRIFWINLLPEGAMCHICCSRGLEHHGAPRYFLLDARLLTLGELLLEELQSARANSPDIARAHLMALLLRVERDLQGTGVAPDASGQVVVSGARLRVSPTHIFERSNTAVFQRACHYIENHLSEPLNATLIANQTYVSPSHLNRLFRAELNVSLMKFVEAQRIKAARSLLTNTNLPVSLIGQYVGYPRVTHFSLIFKRNEGLSPSQYRRCQHDQKPLARNKLKSINQSRNK